MIITTKYYAGQNITFPYGISQTSLIDFRNISE